MRELALPMPATQVVLYDDGYIEIRVDFYWSPCVSSERPMASRSTRWTADPMAALRAERERERILRELRPRRRQVNWPSATIRGCSRPVCRAPSARAEQRRGRAG